MSKLLDTVMVFLKELFKKDDFGKISRQKKHENLSSRQKIKTKEHRALSSNPICHLLSLVLFSHRCKKRLKFSYLFMCG